MSEDFYAKYMLAYTCTLTGNFRNIETPDMKSAHAVALGIEDAMWFRALCDGKITSDDDEHHGYRERWKVAELIELGEAAEPPPEDDA